MEELKSLVKNQNNTKKLFGIYYNDRVQGYILWEKKLAPLKNLYKVMEILNIKNFEILCLSKNNFKKNKNQKITECDMVVIYFDNTDNTP